MRLARSIALIAASLGLAASASCSLVLDFPQCVEDIDCTNSEGLELVCRASECVVPTEPSAVECSDTAQCVAEFDETVVCGRTDTCASLVSEFCEVLIQPEASGIEPDDITYIGSILPRTGTYQSMGVPLENAVRLAVEDFNNTATLPGGRRVGWVACDSAGDSDQAEAAARTLSSAGVGVIVGPGLSKEMVATVGVTAARDTLLMSPTASAGIFANLIDAGLVWRTTGNDGVQAAGIADRIAALEPAPQRVVVLAKADQYGEGLLGDLTPRLEAFVPDGGLHIETYSGLETFADTDTLLSEYGARIAAAFDHDPDVVVVLGSVEARELVLFYLEAWVGAEPRPTLPRFVLSSEAGPMVRPIVEGVSESFRATLMSRLESVGHAAQDPDNYGSFEIRYGIRFPGLDAGLDAGLAYDATMTSLLALSALPEGSRGGIAAADAIARLADPAATEVSFSDGLSFITSAQEVLAGGGNMMLRGVSGPLRFNVDNGDLRRELTGYDVETASTGEPRLVPRRRYALDAEPSVTGTWMDL